MCISAHEATNNIENVPQGKLEFAHRGSEVVLWKNLAGNGIKEKMRLFKEDFESRRPNDPDQDHPEVALWCCAISVSRHSGRCGV